jgi:hypothetical protein
MALLHGKRLSDILFSPLTLTLSPQGERGLKGRISGDDR